jgi:hypothetical protein
LSGAPPAWWQQRKAAREELDACTSALLTAAHVACLAHPRELTTPQLRTRERQLVYWVRQTQAARARLDALEAEKRTTTWPFGRAPG